MKYAFTIYTDESQRESATPEQMEQVSQAYGAVTQEMQEKGILVAGDGLYPTATATTVRVPDGKGGDVVTSDGPYAETKEALTGFYLFECADLDEAVALAAQLPAAWNGAVEVRPVIQF
jgi:hypothetical protein